MREILFRGKRHDGTFWVYGDLIHYESGETAIFSDKLSKYGYEATEITKRTKVIPETVGQYTGLCDKNGTKIFEGDIVQDYIEQTYTVVFFEGCFCTWSDYFSEYQDLCDDHSHEVMGNIHDNKELL